MTAIFSTLHYLLLVSACQSGFRRIRKLGAKSQRMQHLIQAGHFVEASGLAEDIITSISPSAEDQDIEILFRFINQSLTHYVPLIGGQHDTVLFQIGLNIYVTLLQELCRKDHLHDPAIRLQHRIRLQKLLISILKGIERRVSRSYHRYHDKYKELQRITWKLDELYVRLIDPVPCRWMRLMNDAATLQKLQPRKDGVVDSHYNKVIDYLYTNAIRLFVEETKTLRRASKCDNAAYLEMFKIFSWIADELPMTTALEYCVSLSRRANDSSELGRFQNMSRIFYYDCLAGTYLNHIIAAC